ncbi:MAG: response regulator [Pseudomonadota bacterium]
MTTRVLVADDDEGMRETLAEILTEEGHEVATASDAEEALALCRVNRFDVVLLDQRMPGRSGFEVLDDLRESSPATRIIMMSAYAVDELKRNALTRGVMAFVDKPLNLEMMLDLVRDAGRAAVLVITADVATDALVMLLRQRGYRVRSAATAQEGMRLAAQIAFRIVIIDCELSSSNGLETYLELKAILPSFDAIMLTRDSESDHAIAREAVRRTAYTYVDKPDAETRIPELLGQLVGQQASGSQRMKPNPD